MNAWYDVAIWLEKPPLFPAYVGYIQSSSAFQAIENTMHFYSLKKAVYASARAFDGSIIYRCVKVSTVIVEALHASKRYENVSLAYFS